LLDLPGQREQAEPAPLPTQAARYRLFSALQETLTTLAENVNILLIVDDLQWADELSLDFLETLSTDFLAHHRVLVVGTYRSEEATPRLLRMRDDQHTPCITLGRFEAAAMEQLVSDMLGADEVSNDLLAPLLAASEGNAFFAAEYLRVAVDEGVIDRNGNGNWYFDSKKYHANKLPDTLRALIEHRLTALSESARKMLDVAAVIGRESDSDMLVATAEITEGESLDALEELVTRAFLEEVQGNAFRFVHDKLREVTYEAIPKDRCSLLHQDRKSVV